MQNISRYVEHHARVRPESDAVIFNDQRISWSELQRRVIETSAGLANEGVVAGVIVALVMKNSAAFIELVYAISRLGGVALLVNYRLSAEEATYITNHAGAALIVADDELIHLTATAGLKVIALDAQAQSRAALAFGTSNAESAPSAGRAGGDLFRLMYTSGTTDRPKGVTHSYDNFYWKCFDHIVILGLSAEDRLCVAGPLYHVGACDLPGLGVHIAGGALVILREFDAQAVMSAIETEKITGIWLAPVMTNAVLGLDSIERFDASTLKWCIGGGERTPESRIRTFMRAFPNARYIDAYGMTETVSGDTFMQRGFEISKIGSVGRAAPTLDLEIRDDAGQTLPAGAEGEICMRGPKVTAGYWKDPDRTRDAMWPDGFLRSGDVGYLDEDGFLFLTDRKKDMIISGGENISSSEVERVLYEMPEIKEAAVIGRADERWGETPVAVAVLNDGATLNFEQVNTFCRARLAGFKCPKDLILVEALPRNPSGKILKRMIRQMI